MWLQLVHRRPPRAHRVRPARIRARLERRVVLPERNHPHTREILPHDRPDLGQQRRVRCIRPRVVVHHDLPLHLPVVHRVRKTGPPTSRPWVKFATIPYGFRTVAVQRVFGRKVHKKRRACLGKPQGVVVGRDDVRVHRRLDPVCIRRPITALVPTQQRKHILGRCDHAKRIRHRPCVQQAMRRLDPRADRDGRGTLKDGLRSLVVSVPLLHLVPEYLRDPPDVDLPRRIQPRVPQLGERAHRRRAVARVVHRPIKQVRIQHRVVVRG